MARFVVDDSSFCLVNCHLAAGMHHVRQRNQDLADILEAKEVFPAAADLTPNACAFPSMFVLPCANRVQILVAPEAK
jgi:hypothetical protein